MTAGQAQLEQLIEAADGFDHLRVKKHGEHLILYSGADDDEQKHARLTHMRGDEWGLSFWKHTGRWEKTPFTGTMAELFSTLTDLFPMFLEHY
jgi:hypothetical protein